MNSILAFRIKLVYSINKYQVAELAKLIADAKVNSKKDVLELISFGLPARTDRRNPLNPGTAVRQEKLKGEYLVRKPPDTGM